MKTYKINDKVSVSDDYGTYQGTVTAINGELYKVEYGEGGYDWLLYEECTPINGFNFNIIKDNIMKLNEKYDNAFEVMSGAYWASQEVHCDNPNFDKFVEYLSNLVIDIKFWKWHESIPQAMRTYCKLAMVDPALVEAHIGMRFEEVYA